MILSFPCSHSQTLIPILSFQYSHSHSHALILSFQYSHSHSHALILSFPDSHSHTLIPDSHSHTLIPILSFPFPCSHTLISILSFPFPCSHTLIPILSFTGSDQSLCHTGGSLSQQMACDWSVFECRLARPLPLTVADIGVAGESLVITESQPSALRPAQDPTSETGTLHQVILTLSGNCSVANFYYNTL